MIRRRAGGARHARLAAIGAALLLGVAPFEWARAHHAWTEVDTGRTITLTGTVKALKWEHPHASLVLETVENRAPVDWTVLMSGPARLEGRGLERATIAVGRRLTIVAAPARDDTHVVRANRVQSDGQEYVLY